MVGALVPMVPEGLVLMTSIAFAVGVIRLGRRQCLVNELPAILRSAPGDVDLGSIPLEIVAKDELIERIEKQVQVARNR